MEIKRSFEGALRKDYSFGNQVLFTSQPACFNLLHGIFSVLCTTHWELTVDFIFTNGSGEVCDEFGFVIWFVSFVFLES